MSDLSKDFEKGLKKILAFDDEIIVFQTQIFKTCLFYNLSGQKVSKEILRILEKKFKNKTILLPSFSNDLAIKKKYDEILSIPNTGIIPTAALKSKKYFRTSSPLHSFLVKGRLVKEIKKLNPQTTWGTGSVFEWLEKKNAIKETDRRRSIQVAYNKKHKISATSIKKEIGDVLESVYEKDYVKVGTDENIGGNLKKHLKALNKKMKDAATNLEFEEAAKIRDEIRKLEASELEIVLNPKVKQYSANNKIYPKGRSTMGLPGTRAQKGKKKWKQIR